jgi:hypothetical protein
MQASFNFKTRILSADETSAASDVVLTPKHKDAWRIKFAVEVLMKFGGAETGLTEIAPHPLHVNFEIHGYLCDRCGPVKSVVMPSLTERQAYSVSREFGTVPETGIVMSELGQFRHFERPPETSAIPPIATKNGEPLKRRRANGNNFSNASRRSSPP